MPILANIDPQSNIVLNIVAGDISIIDQDPLRWKISSMDATKPNPKKRLANIGDTYIPDLDIFMPVKPYASWVLSADKMSWVPPVPFPEEPGEYQWDESSISWVIVQGSSST